MASRTAISVGFLGTLFIVKPTPDAFDAWALLGILCAILSAFRDLITRQLDLRTPTIVVSFMAAVAVMVAGLALGFVEQWHLMRPRDFALLAVAAGFSGCWKFLGRIGIP